MRAFIPKKDFRHNFNKFTRSYKASQSGNNIEADRAYIDCGEGIALRDAMRENTEFKSLSDDELVIFVDESSLLSWPQLPVRIGRISANIFQKELHMHDEPSILEVQLEALKQRKIDKKHFRIAVINGYGSNLGDAMMGATAMRYVGNIVSQKLGSVAIDIFLGVGANGTNPQLTGYESFIAQTYFEGPTLQDLTKYDAYFDFTNLIFLPKFTQMPIVDWYLWWMGLDPSAVSLEEKQNKVTIDWGIWQEVAKMLGEIGSKKKILFNPKASVPLRSCPEEVAVKFIKKLLKFDKDLTIILSSPLESELERVYDVSTKISSHTDYFSSLVGQMDGIISVDTFSVHLGDALNIPTVGLFSSVSPDAYPYYSLHKGLLIPKGEKLPFFGKSKVSQEEWESAKDAYAKAWSNLDVKEILRLLEEKIKEKKDKSSVSLPYFINRPHTHETIKKIEGKQILRYEYSPAIFKTSTKRLIDISKVLVKPGMEVICVTPGQSEFPLALAKAVSSVGRINLFEPRKIRQTLILGDLLTNHPSCNIASYAQIPISGCKQARINNTDPFGQTNPLIWGNMREQTAIEAKSIDSFEFENCDCIALIEPIPMKSVILGAIETIKKYRPNLLFAPINKDEAYGVVSLLKNENYDFWAEVLRDESGDESLILIGIKGEQKLSVSGFAKIKTV